jgi:hypothetical protein
MTRSRCSWSSSADWYFDSHSCSCSCSCSCSAEGGTRTRRPRNTFEHERDFEHEVARDFEHEHDHDFEHEHEEKSMAWSEFEAGCFCPATRRALSCGRREDK